MLAVFPRAALAQSVTSGALEGVVTDEAGEPMIDVTVTVTGPSGPPRTIDTDSRGRFRLDLLSVGEYELLAERLGFRPHLIRGINIGQGRTASVHAQLSPASPPVDRVDTTSYTGSSVHPVPGVAVSSNAMLDLPWDRRDLLDLAERSSLTTSALGAWGLPPEQAGIEIDGLGFNAARHPDHGYGRYRSMAFPMEAAAYSEIMGMAADVERPSAPAGLLAATTRRGGRQQTVTGYLEASPGALVSPSEFDKPETDPNSFGGAVAVAGPVAGDTAQYMLMAGFRRDARAVAPLLDPENATSAAIRDAVVQRYGEAWEEAWLPATRTTSVFHSLGRVDWNISERQVVFGRLGYARMSGDSDLHGRAGHPLVLAAEGSDFTVALGLASRVSEPLAIELRAGLESSGRTYSAPETDIVSPWTSLVEDGLVLGGDPAGIGDFQRTTITLRQTTHGLFGRHQLKFGGGADLSSHDIVYTYNGSGSYIFSDLTALTTGNGVLERKFANDPPGFSISDFYLFLQDQWMPTPGFELYGGVRLSRTSLPTDQVVENTEWLALSGQSNALVDGPPLIVSPRFGFRWDPTGRGTVVVEGAGGRFAGELNPGTVGTWLADGASASILRRVGDTGAWPEVPGPSSSAVPTVTLLNPEIQAPLTDRGSVGVKFGLPGGASLGIAGTVAITTHLPRWTDVNRIAAPVGRDADGRPLFGELRKIGGLIVAEPGTNRRFRDFDVVNVVNSNGEAQHWGISAFGEVGSTGGSRAFVRYTYSKTEDDWLAGGGDPRRGLDPLPGGVDGADWSDGRSDFDVPHRVAAGAEINVPGFPVRISGLYRFASGLPFTPGFRPGVDINGDGVAGNDPAFVSAGSDLAGLNSEWPCLADRIGGYIERNACRGPDVSTLDLRVAVNIGTYGGSRFELLIDGIDLLGSDLALRDRALYLVDPEGSITTDPSSGAVRVPLVINPDFGQPLLPLSSGRYLRVALQVRN